LEDSKKIIGETGGIHYSNAKNETLFYDDISKIMSMGNGGDGPENNMEASNPYRRIGCRVTSVASSGV
jgi:hypothetical protein